MKVRLHGGIFVLPLALLAGCSSTGDTRSVGAVVEDRGMGTEGITVSTGAAGAETSGGYSLDDPNSPLARRVIYFDYDSSEILTEDQQLISDHAAYLAADGGLRVTLEGNTDERGSPEYNIALGDRRAQSVRRAFELQGVMPEQITIVSYGEEKPAAEDHSEAAWRLNRRVEIVYQSD
jgi:peptidoglycan-associated lipoprotein